MSATSCSYLALLIRARYLGLFSRLDLGLRTIPTVGSAVINLVIFLLRFCLMQ